MEKSKVYFTNLRTTFDCNLLQKLKKLITCGGHWQHRFYQQVRRH